MHANVGMIDRVIRVIIGLLLIAYAVPVGFPATGWELVRLDRRHPDPHCDRRHLPGL